MRMRGGEGGRGSSASRALGEPTASGLKELALRSALRSALQMLRPSCRVISDDLVSTTLQPTRLSQSCESSQGRLWVRWEGIQGTCDAWGVGGGGGGGGYGERDVCKRLVRERLVYETCVNETCVQDLCTRLVYNLPRLGCAVGGTMRSVSPCR